MGSHEEAPLLVPAVEGCPGCVMERRKASSNGRIPYRELFFVAATSLASGTTHVDISSYPNSIMPSGHRLDLIYFFFFTDQAITP